MRVAVIGAPNVGKSSIVNAIVGEPVGIVTDLAGTTRDLIRGFAGNFEIIDTPGMLKSDDLLSKHMRKSISAGVRDADVILYVIDSTNFRDIDLEKIANYREKQPVVVAINKTDRTTFQKLYPRLEMLNKLDFVRDIVPVSAKTGFNIDVLVAALNKLSTTKKTIDLHIHTTHSDGVNTTQEIIDIAAEHGADIIAITDHDSVGAYFELPDVNYRGTKPIEVIKGVELCFHHGEKERHMLGYGIDEKIMHEFILKQFPPDKMLARERKFLAAKTKVLREMGLIIDDGLTINHGSPGNAFLVIWNSVMRYPQNIERFPQIRDPEKFGRIPELYIHDDTIKFPTMRTVIDIIHKAGGLAFLAHPLVWNCDRLVGDAIKAGIDGLEIQHNSNLDGHVQELEKIARENNLYTSGGSDYHGGNKPGVKMVTARGNMRIDFSEIRPWYDKVAKVKIEPNTYTNQSVRQMASEILRAAIIKNTRAEIPHGVAVMVTKFTDNPGATEIHADIICEKQSHKPIIIGKGGAMLKKIGTEARREIEQLVDGHVKLYTHVLVRPNWKDDRETLERLHSLHV